MDNKAENIRIPPLEMPSAADESTKMHLASLHGASATARRSPLHGRHYPSLHNNLYIPHQATVPDPTLFSPVSPPEDKTSDVEKRDILRRRHHKHHRSRHERDEKHTRSQSFPIEHVTDMPFQLGKKKARAAAVEAEGKAKAREKEKEEEKVRRLREAKEVREELAGRFPFSRQEEVLKKADLEELREKRAEEERANSKSLDDIAAESNAFSQRLDKACYNLLDNAANIRTSIRSVQAITNRTIERHRDFDVRSSAMLREAKAQIMKFDNFNRQARSIDHLEARILAAQKEAAALDKRLREAQETIITWDREEDEWQAKVTRRLRLAGAAIVLFFVALIGTKIAYWWRSDSTLDACNPKPTIEMIKCTDAVVCVYGVSAEGACLELPMDIKADPETPTGLVDYAASVSTPIEPAALEEPLQRIIDEL